MKDRKRERMIRWFSFENIIFVQVNKRGKMLNFFSERMIVLADVLNEWIDQSIDNVKDSRI